MVRAKRAIMGSPKSHQTFRGEEEQQSERALAFMWERAIRSLRRRSAPTGRYAAETGAGTGSGTTAPFTHGDDESGQHSYPSGLSYS